VLGQHLAELGRGAHLVVGHDLDQDGDATRTIGLVGDLLVGDAGELTGTLLDRALDVVGRHVESLGRADGGTQARVPVRIAAAIPGRDGDFLDDPRESRAPLGIGRALLVLDGMPLGMT
jgi:hypothetical protein